ncbi:MAG: PfkB family carbohydrate kinase [Candidatus Beckwithbacteria bacterium]
MLKLTALGDICVDIYPSLDQYFLGGTSYNFCLTASRLGTKTSLVSAVGQDDWGKKYLLACKKQHINTDYLSVLPGKTSQVEIDLDSRHRPIFHGWQLGVLKSFRLNQSQLKFLTTQSVIRAICLKPLLPIFKQFCQLKTKAIKVADFAGGSIYSPSLSTIKTYFPFVDFIITSQELTDSTALALLKQLAVKHHKLCLVTHGHQGSQVFTDKNNYFCPAQKIKSVDTTGAGDTYLANFLISYYKTNNILASMKIATQAAAKKITSFGASS